MPSAPRHSVAAVSAPLVGDHPALNLINTLSMVDGELYDHLRTDADVLAWLASQDMPVHPPLTLTAGSLLAEVVRLRVTLRTAVEKKKAGKPFQTAELNTLLQAGAGYTALRSHRNGTLTLTRCWHQATAAQVLGPLLESAADFLVSADFNLVRACEDPACVLWFLDTTRSHRRRWCSPATCGNRHKVAAFRARQLRRPQT